MSSEGIPNPNYNPPGAAGSAGVSSRFARGRGRGAHNSKRPYFYRSSTWRKRSKPNIPSVFPQSAASEGGFAASVARSQFFTAPISAGDGQVQIIHITNPLQYSGWRLYFYTETFIESSILVTHIQAFEKHIKNHANNYDLRQILKQEWFNVYAEPLLNDSEFKTSWEDFTQDMQKNPKITLSCLGVAIHQAITTMSNEDLITIGSDPGSANFRSRKIFVPKINARPVDFFPVSSIADISPESYDKIFVVKGRVESITAEETKCTWVAYKCKRCGHEQAIRQGEFYPTKPLRCRIQCNSKRNFVELRTSPYTKIESMKMIQLYETGIPGGIGPRSKIDIQLREDLVDLVSPGNELTVTGILKVKSLDTTGNQEYEKNIKNNFYMEAISLKKHTNAVSAQHFIPTEKDTEIVQMITREPNCLRLLVQSLAPEMCGHEMVKLAVLLSLLGGSGSQLHDDGEINVLLVGDPGVGKSILLQNAANISQRGKFVSGKTPTDFIPTIQNKNINMATQINNCIESGSLITSHAGHCCIDDIDKLTSHQENLIHVIQTKSVSTRSPTVAFNVPAKTAIIASVNPAGGHYDSSKLLRENIRLNPSFMSLFHLIFVLFDKADKDRDNMLADHVKALHSGMKKVLSIPPKYSMDIKPSDYTGKTQRIELDEMLRVKSDEQLDLLPPILLKKYIAYARQNIKPLLSEEAALEIKDFYLGLRTEKNEEERFSITTRQLEGLILMTQARARAELCSEASKEHARDVIELVRHSYTDTSVADRLNSTLNGSIAGTSHGSQVKKFIQMLQLRSNALGRKVFEFEELKDMASHAGIRCGVTNLVELINMQGYLLKKGPNLYEVRIQ